MASSDVETEHFTPESMFIAQTKEQRRQGAEAETRNARVTNYSPLFSLPLIDHNA